ncbi:MAG: hypothetical protein R2941_22425 [Desulfobacterales bacterium]
MLSVTKDTMKDLKKRTADSGNSCWKWLSEEKNPDQVVQVNIQVFHGKVAGRRKISQNDPFSDSFAAGACAHSLSFSGCGAQSNTEIGNPEVSFSIL